MTHIKITGPTGVQEFKMMGPIQSAINKLKFSSPIPNWFWSKLRLNKGKLTTYTSPSGETVTFEMEQHKIIDKLSDAPSKDAKGQKIG